MITLSKECFKVSNSPLLKQDRGHILHLKSNEQFLFAEVRY